MPALSVTLLGTGTSTGVPVIGCACRGCTSTDSRDKRLRCAAHVVARTASGDVHLQIDAGPDLRTQALRYGLHRVDAVLVTHHHFDHVAGLDDLRPFFFDNRTAIPVYASDSTAEILERALPYLFREGSYAGAPRLALRPASAPFDVASRYLDASVRITPIPAMHGPTPVLGFRVGDFGYLTDVNQVGDRSLALLAGTEVLVLDALRRDPHPTHLSIDEAVALAERVGARQTYFVHMTHSVLHAEEDARLPAGMNLAYDGLAFELG